MEVGGLMRTGKRAMEPPELLLVAPSLTPGGYVIVGIVVSSSDLALSAGVRQVMLKILMEKRNTIDDNNHEICVLCSCVLFVHVYDLSVMILMDKNGLENR